ncbi:unnamed protein product [Adineta steineri]|uniref:NAD(P)(+)--arginine ADP-ribosyltransferase n=1 Tax=Adineta steineri TaxID=433720 RepID=A0A816EAV4_9BILA|nr:unnamed protein product [Adineta steineri]CAF1644256.1 unnamed protein product [Adineta steineri]
MATGGNIDLQQSTRVSDIVNEPQDMLVPIRGYENMPIVSLEKAVTPLILILPEIQDYAYVAKRRCKSVPPDGLTQDESAALTLYSMEWTPHDKCLYFVLNATLRTEDRRKLKPWFSYLKLILTALEKLPSIRCHVFRGVNLDLTNLYTQGKTFIWWGFSSCTTSLEVLENKQFLDKTDQRTLFTIECDSGKDISRHSYYQSENEVLLLPARQFFVVGCLQLAPDLHTIQLKETKAPITLLQPVMNQSVQINPIPNSTATKSKNPITKFRKILTRSRSQSQIQQNPSPSNHTVPSTPTIPNAVPLKADQILTPSQTNQVPTQSQMKPNVREEEYAYGYEYSSHTPILIPTPKFSSSSSSSFKSSNSSSSSSFKSSNSSSSSYQCQTESTVGGASAGRIYFRASNVSTSQMTEQSAQGDIAFERIDPQRDFIAIKNAAAICNDQAMKNWTIRRKIDFKEDIVYRFPDNFVLQSGSRICIFSRYGSIGLVNQKEALVADNIPTWGTGSHMVTRLLDANGHENAFYDEKFQ